jgi:hypothetical protein
MPRLRRWLRPPRDLMILFLLVMLAPAATLVVLGFRLFEQDRRSRGSGSQKNVRVPLTAP